MTVLNAIKKLSKLGDVKNTNKVFYSVKINDKTLNFIDNRGSGNAICFHIDHYQEGKKYHTTYFDNLGQMIKYI